MRTALRATLTLSFIAVLGGPGAACAQDPPASQHGTLSQTVNNPVISMGYDRPVARGRSEVGPYRATLRFHWGSVVVPLGIDVPAIPFAGG